MTTATKIKEFVSVEASSEFSASTDHKDDDWVIPGLVVLKEESKNGRLYSIQARQDAARLCEGLPLASEHEDETRIQSGNSGRLWHDRLGSLERGYLDKKGNVRADVRLNEHHPHARLFRENCRRFPKNACLSVEIGSDGFQSSTTSDGRMQVDRISEMLDLSVVARGGTTRSLYESDNSKQKDTQMADDKQIETVVDEKLREQDERRRVKQENAELRVKLDTATKTIEQQCERIAEFEAADEKRKKIASIKEQAESLNCPIDDKIAGDLALLPDERVTESLKERAELIKNAKGKKDDADHFYRPTSSDAGNVDDEVTDAEKWLIDLKNAR